MMPRADHPRILRIRTLRAFPIERPDILDRAKIFGDVHRRSSFELDRLVVPIVDVTPFNEQQPAFYSSLGVAAGGAGAFSAVELANGPLSKTIGRPLFATLKSSTAQDVGVFTAPHEFLGGAPAANGGAFDDSRRGVVTANPGSSVLTLRGSAAVANAAPAIRLQLTLQANVELVFQFADLLRALVVAPNVDLVFAGLTAVTDLKVNLSWSEEPAAQATRGLTA